MSVIVAGSTTLDEVDDAGRLVVVGTVVVVGSTVVVGARLVDTAVAEPVTGSPAPGRRYRHRQQRLLPPALAMLDSFGLRDRFGRRMTG